MRRLLVFIKLTDCGRIRFLFSWLEGICLISVCTIGWWVAILSDLVSVYYKHIGLRMRFGPALYNWYWLQLLNRLLKILRWVLNVFLLHSWHASWPIVFDDAWGLIQVIRVLYRNLLQVAVYWASIPGVFIGIGIPVGGDVLFLASAFISGTFRYYLLSGNISWCC